MAALPLDHFLKIGDFKGSNNVVRSMKMLKKFPQPLKNYTFFMKFINPLFELYTTENAMREFSEEYWSRRTHFRDAEHLLTFLPFKSR